MDNFIFHVKDLVNPKLQKEEETILETFAKKIQTFHRITGSVEKY